MTSARIRIAVLAVIAVAISITACRKPWYVIRQAPGVPFAPKAQFIVAEINFDGVQVGEGLESTYLEDKSPKTRAEWENDKSTLAARLVDHLAMGVAGQASVVESTGEADFVIRGMVEELEPGWFAGSKIGSASATATVQFLITTPSGEVVDEFLIDVRAQASTFSGVTITQRFEVLGERTGKIVARYILDRMK